MENAEEKKPSNLSKDYSTTVTILEHLSDALFILNPSGRVEYANRVALDMLGLKFTDILGQPLNNYLVADFKPDMLYNADDPDVLLENIYKGVFSEIETSLINKEYSTSVVISFGLVKDAANKVSFIIASAKDITIRKELEKELQQQQLISLSRDRYRELGELAVNMVHNLSQPITSIRLMIEMMQKQLAKDEIDSDKFKKYLKESTTLLDAMTTNITNVRNFAFLTEDDSVKTVMVPEIVEGALKQLDYELKDRDFEVSLNSEKNLPPVSANPISLQQVFITLIKYLMNDAPETSDDSISAIYIQLENMNDRWVSISLSNHDDNKNKNDINKNGKPLIGSHLDLTVVQIILTSLGGDFNMQATESNRVTFTLRIPVGSGGERDQLRNMIELLHQ